MAKKYLIYKANELCCQAGKLNWVENWSYVPDSGFTGNVYSVENTYWRGNALKYIWIEADEQQIDDCGNLKGDLKINIRCLDPCVLENRVKPLSIVQIGGIAMPESMTLFRGMRLGNCVGPTVLSPIPPSVKGFDLPQGANVKVQMFGGFGMSRTINASNGNLGGQTQKINNRVLSETANNQDGFYVPWLKGSVDGQIAAGKKMIFERKFGEGNHTFEFSANKVGPTYFSAMDEASCIRYWVVHVLPSHCYDWKNKQKINGPNDATPKIFTKEGDVNTYEGQDPAEYSYVLQNKTSIIPIGKDPDLMDSYSINTNIGSASAICDCDLDNEETTLKKGLEDGDSIELNQWKKDKADYSKNNPDIYSAGDKMVLASRHFGIENNAVKSDDGRLHINVPRSVHFGEGGGGERSAWVGESVDVTLPASFSNSAYHGSNKRPKVKVLKQPLLPEDSSNEFRGHGFAGINTGPIAHVNNDDSQFVSATLNNKGNKLTLSSDAPTNFLPSFIELDMKLEGESLYAQGTNSFRVNRDAYKWFGPTAPAEPKEIVIKEDEEGVATAEDDEGSKNSLHIEDMGLGEIIPWTQRALLLAFRALCPPVDISVESRPPHNADFQDKEVDKYKAWDYGEGTELKFIAKLPDDYSGKIASPSFHLPEPEVAHPKNRYFGDNAVIGGPARRGWKNAEGSGTEFNKVYKLNSKAGDNNKGFVNNNISIYFAFKMKGGPQIANPLVTLDQWGPKGAAVINPFTKDGWFEKGDDENSIFWDKRHQPDGDWTRYFKRDFADKWEGAHEQLRGCHCVTRNTTDLIVVRQPPILDNPKDGKPVAIRIDDLEEGIGIIFNEGPGQEDGDFDQLL